MGVAIAGFVGLVVCLGYGTIPILYVGDDGFDALARIAEVRAILHGTLSPLASDDPVSLVFLALADQFTLPAGRVLIVGAALRAVFLTIIFTRSIATRLPLGIGALLTIIMAGLWAQPMLTPDMLALSLLLLVFIILIIPSFTGARDAGAQERAASIDGTISAMLIPAIGALWVGGLAIAVGILLVSAFVGGQGRLRRYWTATFLLLAVALAGGFFAEEVFRDLASRVTEFSAGMMAREKLLLVAGAALFFSALLPTYHRLYNRPAFLPLAINVPIAVGILLLSLGQANADLKTLTMVLQQSTQQRIAGEVNDHAMAAITPSARQINVASDLATLGLEKGQHFSVLFGRDIACLFDDRRPCQADGLAAAHLADIVLVPTVMAEKGNRALVTKAQGLLYSDFVRAGEHGSYIVWHRRVK